LQLLISQSIDIAAEMKK